MSALHIGSEAIPFELPAVDGSTVALDDYKDRNVVAVIFTCNHCPYAQAWEGRIIKAQADYGDRGVQVIAINANDPERYADDNFENMKKRAEEKGFNFPYLQDTTQEIASAYGATRTPEVFLFDKSRKLVYHGAIDDNYEEPDEVTEAYMRNAIDAALAGEEAPTQTTPPVGCTIKWK